MSPYTNIASLITFSLDLFIGEFLRCGNIWFLLLDRENKTSIGFFFLANMYCTKAIANKGRPTPPVCCCTGTTVTVINLF